MYVIENYNFVTYSWLSTNEKIFIEENVCEVFENEN